MFFEIKYKKHKLFHKEIGIIFFNLVSRIFFIENKAYIKLMTYFVKKTCFHTNNAFILIIDHVKMSIC